MYKRLCFVLIVAVAVSLFGIPAFGAENDTLSSLVANKNTVSTDQIIVNVTRPEGNETTYKKSFVICGNTDSDSVAVSLYRYDSSSERFVEFNNSDGTSSWNIGSSGFFTKEIVLSDGANRIRLVAYRKADADKLKAGDNLQISDFTITVLNLSIKDKIKNGLFKLSDMLTELTRDIINNSKQ